MLSRGLELGPSFKLVLQVVVQEAVVRTNSGRVAILCRSFAIDGRTGAHPTQYRFGGFLMTLASGGLFRRGLARGAKGVAVYHDESLGSKLFE
jgi:hypothetical protein